MDVTAESIRSKYQALSTDDLKQIFQEGGLSPEAMQQISEELEQRGSSEEEAIEFHPVGRYMMGWYSIYTYVRLPLCIIASAIIFFVTASEFSESRIVILFFVLLGIFQGIVLYGMALKRAWVIRQNEFLLGCEAVILVLHSVLKNELWITMIVAVPLSFLWFHLNRVYFRNRADLFT